MINLGNIYFGITPDISQLQRAVSEIQKFGLATERAARSQTEGAQQAARALSKQEGAMISAFRASVRLTDQMNKAGAGADNTDRLKKRLELLVKALADGKLGALEYDRAIRRWQIGLDNSKRALDKHVEGQRAAAKVATETTKSWNEQNKAGAAQTKVAADIERAYAQRDRQLAASGRNQAKIYNDQAAAQRKLAAEEEAIRKATERETEQGLAAIQRLREKAAKDAQALQDRLSRVTGAASFRNTGFQESVRRAGAPGYISDKGTNALQDLQGTLRAPGLAQADVVRAIDQYKRSMQAAQIELRRWQDAEKASDRQMKQTEAYLKGLETQYIKVAGAISQATIKEEAFLNTVARTGRRLTGNASAQNELAGIGAQASGARANLASALSTPGISRSDQAAAVRAYREEMSRAEQALKNFQAAHVGANRDVGILSQMFRTGARSVELMTGPLGGVAVRLNVLSSILNSSQIAFGLFIAGIAAGAYAFIKISEAVIHFEKDLDTASRGMTAINGNATVTELQIRGLMETANATGTSFHELLGPFARWTEATKNTGLEGERATTVFRQMAQVSGQLGLPFEKFSSIFTNFQRLLATNSVTARELHQRLETELPGSAIAAAKALGVTTAELDHLQREGINAQEFIVKFSKAYVDMFGGMNKPVEGITAAQNRWHNSLLTLWDSIDKVWHISQSYVATLEKMAKLVNEIATIGLGATINEGVLNTFANLLDKIDIGGVSFHNLAQQYRDAATSIVASAQKSSSGLTGALPAFEKFVEAQRTARFQTDPAATDTYIADIKRQLAEQEKAYDTATVALKEYQRLGKAPETSQYAYENSLLTLATNADTAQKKAAKLGIELQKLQEIRKKATGPEKFDKATIDPKAWNAERDALKNIMKLEEEMGGMGFGEDFFKRTKEAATDTTAIETFTNKLKDAHVADLIGTDGVTKLIDRYSAATRTLRENTRQMAEIKTPFQVMEDMFKGLEGSVNTFTQAIFDGTLSMKTFGTIGKKILQDLMNEIIKLGLLAPLIKALFGGSGQTLGLTSGGGIGVAGIFGRMFGGSGGSGGASSGADFASGGFNSAAINAVAARGMAVTPGGFRYAMGGSIFSRPTAFPTARGPVLGGEAGAEALLPLTRVSGGKLGVHAKISGGDSPEHPTGTPVNVHFHGAPQGTRVEQRSDESGSPRMDVFFDSMMARAVTQRGSGFQKAMGGAFGVGPRTIRRGAA